jgi:hypothetical protein
MNFSWTQTGMNNRELNCGAIRDRKPDCTTFVCWNFASVFLAHHIIFSNQMGERLRLGFSVEFIIFILWLLELG